MYPVGGLYLSGVFAARVTQIKDSGIRERDVTANQIKLISFQWVDLFEAIDMYLLLRIKMREHLTCEQVLFKGSNRKGGVLLLKARIKLPPPAEGSNIVCRGTPVSFIAEAIAEARGIGV